MDLDTLLHHYFGTDDVAALPEAQFERGREALLIDFGVEREPGRRFALWALMHMLGIAPDLGVAFKTEKEREAARRFADLSDRMNRTDD